MISIDQLTGIRAFVETAQAGSFTLASERLALSRSAVSKAVARLEAQLGVRLLHRSTRRLALTEDGRAFHRHCLRALATLAQGESELRQKQGAVAGTLRIEVPVLFGRQWIAPALLELAREHPALHLDVAFLNRFGDMASGQVDLAVRIGALPDSSHLVARPLGVQRTVVCAAPAYLAARGRPTDPATLAAHDCLVEGRDSTWLLADAQGELQAFALGVRLTLRDAMALRDAAAAGFGLARLPRWLVAAQLADGTLEEVLPQQASTASALPIHVIWPHQGALAARQRVVVDHLLARFVPVAPWER